MNNCPMLSVTQTAEQLGIGRHAVLALIKSGELRASDISLNREGRPRWRIHPDDLEMFISRRTHQASPPRRRRRKKRQSNVKQFF